MSEASAAAADAFIAAHRSEAAALGRALVERTEDPEVFVRTLRQGLWRLSDPAYAEMVERVAPGTGCGLGVRGPLVEAVRRPLRTALRDGSSASALSLAQRLAAADDREVRLFALLGIERSLADDPERTWQLMRRMGRRAGDWIEVDSLAEPWAAGVLAEPFRWAELEQLVYSDLTMERRLVGATLARIPHRLPSARRQALRGEWSQRAYALMRLLMGDAEAMVQKALSWAVREWARVDLAGAERLLRDETAVAVEQADGNRAWVIRDARANLPPELTAELRERLTGLRRDPGRSTSIAAAQAADFTSALASADGAIAHQGDRYTRSLA
jgi:3-methyladenine DNA glycosylase AlkD